MSERSSLNGSATSRRNIQSSLMNSSKTYGRGGGTSNDRSLMSSNQVYAHAYTKPVPFKRQEAYSKKGSKVVESTNQSKTPEEATVTIDEETRKQLLEDQERLSDEITMLKREGKNKDDEILSLKEKISKLALLQQNYEDLKKEYLKTQNDKNQIEADYSVVMKQIDVLDSQTGNKDSTIVDQASQIEKLTNSIVNDQQFYQNNEAELRETIDQQSAERKQLQDQVDQLTQKVLTLEQDIANSEESVKIKLDNLDLQVTKLTSEKEQGIQTIIEKQNMIESLQLTIEKLNAQLDEHSKSIDKKDVELKRIPELLNEVEEKKLTIHNYELQLQDLTNTQVDLKNQLAQKELLLQDLQSQLKEMNQIKELYNKNVELLNQMQSNYEELNTNYLTLQKEFEKMNLDYQDTKKRNESSHLLEHIKELKDKEMERRKQAMASQAAQSNDLQMEDDDMMIMMDDEMNNYGAEFSAQEEKPNLSEAVYEVTDQPINIPDKNADDSLWTFETHKEINRQLYALQYDNIMLANKEKTLNKEFSHLQQDLQTVQSEKEGYQKKIEENTATLYNLQEELAQLQEEYQKIKETGDYETILEMRGKISELESSIEGLKIDRETAEKVNQAYHLEHTRDPNEYEKKLYDVNDCIPLREYKNHELLKIRDNQQLQEYQERIIDCAGPSEITERYERFMEGHNDLEFLNLENEMETKGEELVQLNNEILYYENLDTLLYDNDHERVVLKETIRDINNKIEYVNNELCLTKNYLLTQQCYIQLYRCKTLNSLLAEMDLSVYKLDLLTSDPEELKLIRSTIDDTLHKCEEYLDQIAIESIRYRHETIDYQNRNRSNLIVPYFCEEDQLHLKNTLYDHCENVFATIHFCDYKSMQLACKLFKNIQYNERNQEAINRYISLHTMCSHPNIEHLYGICKSPSLGLLTDLHTASLQEVLDLVYKGDHFPFTFDMQLRVCTQLLHTINFLHTLKPPVIHGRLHPNNIYVDEYLNIQVADPFLDYLYQDLNISNHRQHNNQVYIAPEILNNHIPSVQSDIYSLGLIMLDIFTGSVTTSTVPDENWKEVVQISNLHPQLKEDIESCISEDPIVRTNLANMIEKLETLTLQHQNKNDSSLLAGKSFIRKPGKKIEKAT